MSNFARVLLVAMSPLAAAVLVACGGGGGGTSATTTPPVSIVPPVVTPPVVTPPTSGSFSGSSDVVAALTDVTKAADGAVTAILSSRTNAVATVAPGIDLSTIVISHPSLTYTVSSSGLSSGGLFTVSSGNNRASVGGTSWAYARYGLIEQDLTLSTTNFIRTSVPFMAAQTFPGAPAAPATYSLTGSLVGRFAVDQATYQEIQCQMSANVTYVGSVASAVLTLTNCKLGQDPAIATGTLNVSSATPASALTAAGAEGFSINYPAQGLSFQLANDSKNLSRFVIAGPNAEHIVGTGQMAGTATVNGVAQKGLVTFAFGARK